ncbi:MAG: hypothetical protein RR234_07470, partial [Christensenella sp.]
ITWLTPFSLPSSAHSPTALCCNDLTIHYSLKAVLLVTNPIQRFIYVFCIISNAAFHVKQNI